MEFCISKMERSKLAHRNRRINIVIFVLLVVVLLSSTAQARLLWVATNGTDAVGANFGTEANPFRTIQFAYNQRNFNATDTVMVKPGTYQEYLTITFGSVVFKSRGGADSTFLDGNGDGTAFYFGYGISESTIVDGFTITRYWPTAISMQGLEGVYSSPQIRNCRIYQNGSVESDIWGAGIAMQYSRSIISNNYIAQNIAFARGAAMDCEFSEPKIINNIFEDNRSLQGDGAAIHVVGRSSSTQDSAILIQNNIFIGNTAVQGHGGAVFLSDYTNANLFNNLFYRDSSLIATADGGGAIYRELFAQALIYNNIFVENYGTATNCFNGDTSFVFNNAFYQNIPIDFPQINCAQGAGNLEGVNPLFVNLAGGDFRLSSNSPLIDAGRNLPYWAHFNDFAGSSRFVGAANDIGPYENCKLAVEDFTWLPLTPCVGELVDFTPAYNAYWQTSIWNFGDGDVDTFYVWDEIMSPKTFLIAGDLTISATFMCETDTVTITRPITVLAAPQAAFTASDTTICVGTTVNFSSTSLGADLTFAWQFSDGGTSTAANPSHQFNIVGANTVRLIAANGCGEDTMLLAINVIDAPAAAVSGTPLTGSAPLQVNFTGSSDYPATGWEWAFGDGGTSTQQSPTYTYLRPGIYQVDLVASNECGTGDRDIRLDYIRATGFDLRLLAVDSLTAPLQRRFTINVDTLFGPYEYGINLNASVLQTPRRGTATVQLSSSQVLANQSFTATVTMSNDLAKGAYDLQVVAVSARNAPRDTIRLQFYSNPLSIAAVTPAVLDFGLVQEDETDIDTVYVNNRLQFPQDPLLSFTVSNVLSDEPQFTPLATASTAIQPGGVFKIPVRFDPTAIGPAQGTLRIVSNDPVAETLYVSLAAQAIPEQKPPKVVATVPAAEADHVLIGSDILIDLNEPLADSTLDAGRIDVRARLAQQQITGTFTVLNDNTRLRLVPAAKLPPYDTIIVRLLGTVRDQSGNSLDGNNNNLAEGSPVDDYVFRFVTGPAVYPGDCNNDGNVNEADVLPLGVFFGQEGPARNLYGEGNGWAPKQAQEWADPRATYADADGDGAIDIADLLTIAQNWSSSHQLIAPTLTDAVDFRQYAEGFRQLRPALAALSGSESGNRMLAIVSSLAAESVLPREFTLLQNYPNPFNPQTQISYALPEGCNVRLTVHNILGQTVRILVDSYEEAGFRSVTWDGTDQFGRSVSSGVYFYRLEAGSYSEIRKMLKLQ